MITSSTPTTQHCNSNELHDDDEVLHPKVWRRLPNFNLPCLLSHKLGVSIFCRPPSLKPSMATVTVPSNLLVASFPWTVNPWNPPFEHRIPLALAVQVSKYVEATSIGTHKQQEMKNSRSKQWSRRALVSMHDHSKFNLPLLWCHPTTTSKRGCNPTTARITVRG